MENVAVKGLFAGSDPSKVMVETTVGTIRARQLALVGTSFKYNCHTVVHSTGPRAFSTGGPSVVPLDDRTPYLWYGYTNSRIPKLFCWSNVRLVQYLLCSVVFRKSELVEFRGFLVSFVVSLTHWLDTAEWIFFLTLLSVQSTAGAGMPYSSLRQNVSWFQSTYKPLFVELGTGWEITGKKRLQPDNRKTENWTGWVFGFLLFSRLYLKKVC